MFPLLRLISAVKLVGKKRCATNHPTPNPVQPREDVEVIGRDKVTSLRHLLLRVGAHTFDNQHQYLFHVTGHRMKLHQRDCFRKKLLNRLDWVERCWKGQGWRVGQHSGQSRASLQPRPRRLSWCRCTHLPSAPGLLML